MKLDLMEKGQAELEKMFVGKTISVVDKAEHIYVESATVTGVGMIPCPTYWINEGKVCILETDAGQITVWDTSRVETIQP